MGKVYYEVLAIPDKEFNKIAIFDIFGHESFSLIYDFERKTTIFSVDAAAVPKIDYLVAALPGLGFSMIDLEIPADSIVFSAYRKTEFDKDLFNDLFDLDLDTGQLEIVFLPKKGDELKDAKLYMENQLSKMDSKETQSVLSDVLSKRINTSFHRDNFMHSEERMLLMEMLESVNRSLLRNGTAYFVYFITRDSTGRLEEYMESRFLVLAKTKGETSGNIRVLPVGADLAAHFLLFRGISDISYSLPTAYAGAGGTVDVGTFMKNSVLETKKEVRIDPSTLNLGSMLTGLPGSGKTNEAMAIVDSILAKDRPSIVIISPTDEWNQFAACHEMNVVKLYDSRTPINFFECPVDADLTKFYEDLAMILSSASNAGPYRNPMEKCMLNAFRKTFSSKKEDPVHVYNMIEESIKKFHAKKTNTGYKYTKHGENIRSALENLRAILSRPEYAAVDGIQLGETIKQGAVFDLSSVSIGTKPYIYALILNQVYAHASRFSMDNDDRLNLLICVEEAQMIFKDKDASAVQDIKSRIQDFRKQGIGLMLLTHNINDIEPSIRRLCQTKLYLKQAPDVAPIAAKDLVFTYADEDAVTQKLKHLDSRIGAFTYVVKKGSDKIAKDTIFIKTREYNNVAAESRPTVVKAKLPPLINVRINLSVTVSPEERRNPLADLQSIKVFYLGEEIDELEINSSSLITARKLIVGKEHTLQVLNKKEKPVFTKDVISSKEIDLNLQIH
ncbi:MAG: DUF87 domain-containing protein [Candidatus Micrarchaeales archaeon]|nr:DUF87 domain-containing protein [Candidatus Micrarchaeales archaeon]